MPDSAEPLTYRFDDFLLDTQAGALLRRQTDGTLSRVQLGSRAFQLLCLLVRRRGAIVTRQEIMDAVWPNLVVEENNLSVQLSNLRRVLDTGHEGGSCILTLSGRGYRLLSPVTAAGRWEPDDAVANSACAEAAVNGEIPPESPSEPKRQQSLAGASVEAGLTAASGNEPDSQSGHWRPPPTYVAAGLCLAFLAILVVWTSISAPWLSGTSVVALVQPQAQDKRAPEAIPTSDERLRWPIAVLPFSRTGDGVDEQTADSIADSIGIDLSQFPGLRVIARQATLVYKERPIDIRRVGRELGVRYVVAGSVRRTDNVLRVSGQLVSAETGEQIWAERFDIGKPGDNRTIEDVARQIAFLAAFRAVDEESARSLRERQDNPSPADILARARSAYNLPPGPERETRMLALYRQAVEADPNSTAALAGLAEALLERLPVWSMWNEDPRTPSSLHQADQLITRAESLNPTSRNVMLARLTLVGRQGQCAEIVPFALRTMDMHPTLSSPPLWLGICLILTGRPAEAIPKFEDSIRVNPRNPSVDSRYRLIGYALLFLGRYDEAVASFLKGIGANRSSSSTTRGNDLAGIAAAQALAGDLNAARRSGAEAVKLWPTITVQSYFPFHITNPDAAAHVARMRDGLRLAGIRDHADEAADPGLPADAGLSDNYASPTPIAVPGARTIRTPDLVALLDQRKPLVLDMNPYGVTIPGAIGLWGAGIGGSLADEHQERLGRSMTQLTGGDRAKPIVTVGWNAERHPGRNLGLRLVALGYTEVYWYRGGREAWLSADLPAAEVTLQDW